MVGGAVWIGSWYLMYLEITRWHHVKPSLAVNTPHPGQPLILLYIACISAPLAVLVSVVRYLRSAAR